MDKIKLLRVKWQTRGKIGQIVKMLTNQGIPSRVSFPFRKEAAPLLIVGIAK